ncbi:MAG: sigma-70 family RNA polymerase sigma factor [Planctomycetota bacterium]
MDEAGTRLETLYRELGPDLLSYLRRRLADRHAAEDLLQETFLQAARRLERVSQAVSPRAWLYTIARNVAATAVRCRRRTEPLPAEVVTESPAEDPRLARVRAAIAELPDTLRETLELRLRCELSYEEIAAVLEIPVGTVRSRLHLALQRLRAALSGA